MHWKQTIGELRGVFHAPLGRLIGTYKIDVEDSLATILPTAALD